MAGPCRQTQTHFRPFAPRNWSSRCLVWKGAWFPKCGGKVELDLLQGGGVAQLRLWFGAMETSGSGFPPNQVCVADIDDPSCHLGVLVTSGLLFFSDLEAIGPRFS